ncbi:MAG: hypothetical protein HZA21_01955, partial [Nitrospirae bacterium]|nr:hypothetical protein [Nitrospirota bacterium]
MELETKPAPGATDDAEGPSLAVRARGVIKSFGAGDTKIIVLKGIDLDVR